MPKDDRDSPSSAGSAPTPGARKVRAGAGVVVETVEEWLKDGGPSHGAALAYYVILSLGPLLVLVVGLLEFFLSAEEVRDQVVGILGDYVGPRAASTAATVLGRAQIPDFLSFGSILTMALLLFGATAVFGSIRGSLNTIWGVEREDQTRWEMVVDFFRGRVRGFLMILLTGLFLAVSFLFTSVVVVLGDAVERILGRGQPVVQILDGGISFVMVGVLFATLYRTLPAARIRWRSVWRGAFATALLFVLGKSAVAWIVSSSSWTSYYGPGASVVAFLAWVYLSAQLFYLGAEFTQVWTRRRGEQMAARRGGQESD